MSNTTPSGADALRKELIADLREVFDASGQETPQIVRDVIEYADSWLRVYIQKGAESAALSAARAQEAAPAAQGEPSDTERLDWLATRWGVELSRFERGRGGPVRFEVDDKETDEWFERSTLREAIDAAMKGE